MLAIADRQVVNLPRGANILTVQAQGQTAQLWALCDSNAPFEPRQIAIYGTGNALPEVVGAYIGTFQMLGGALVWHVFEIPQ